MRRLSAASAPSTTTRRGSGGEIPTVIQHEGWLNKRGAGYAPPGAAASSKTTATQTGDKHLPNNNLSSDNEGDALPPTGRGTTTNNAAPKKSVPASLSSFIQGSKEKRRYFMLVTTQAKVANRDKISEGAPRAELRYYEKGRPEKPTVKPKGVILLTADMKLQVSGANISLVTAERTFYLRPDVPEDQNNSAKARTQASQWANAVQFALQGLRAWELGGAEGAQQQPHPMQDRRSIRGVIDPASQQDRRVARKRSFADPFAAANAKLTTVTEPSGGAGNESPYLELWANFGIEAYDRAVAHFGPAQTDLNRLVEHFKARGEQVKAELEVIEKQGDQSTDVVVKEQKSIADAMQELHKSNQRQALALKEFGKQLTKKVIDPLKFEAGTLSAKLDQVVSQHAAAAAYVDGAKKVLQEAVGKVEALQTVLDNLTASATGAVGGPVPTVPTPTNGARRGSTPQANQDKVEEDLNAARQARRDASQMLVITETKHASSISTAMKALEDLERNRIAVIVTALKEAAQLEVDLMTAISADTPQTEEVFAAVDPSKDIRNSFAKLKMQAEKTRPTGRGRRKNSLMGRNEMFLKSVEAGMKLDA